MEGSLEKKVLEAGNSCKDDCPSVAQPSVDTWKLRRERIPSAGFLKNEELARGNNLTNSPGEWSKQKLSGMRRSERHLRRIACRRMKCSIRETPGLVRRVLCLSCLQT